jgi:hypothetical protein
LGAERSSWRNEAAGFCRARKPGKLRVMHWLAGSGPADLTSGHARLAALMCADHVRERENATGRIFAPSSRRAVSMRTPPSGRMKPPGSSAARVRIARRCANLASARCTRLPRVIIPSASLTFGNVIVEFVQALPDPTPTEVRLRVIAFDSMSILQAVICDGFRPNNNTTVFDCGRDLAPPARIREGLRLETRRLQFSEDSTHAA